MAAPIWAGINHTTGSNTDSTFVSTSIAAGTGAGLKAVRMGMDNVNGGSVGTAFNFTARDATVNAYNAASYQIHTVASPWFHTDGTEAAWRRFISTCMARYSTQIKYWIIGNEPDINNITPTQLGNWCLWAKQERDALNLQGICLIESPPLSKIEWGAGGYFDQMLDANVGTNCDVIGMHCYGGQIADDRINKTWARMAAKGVTNRPLGVSESGISRNRNPPGNQANFYPPGSSATNIEGTYAGGQDEWRRDFHKSFYIAAKSFGLEYVLLFDLSGTKSNFDGDWSMGTISGSTFTRNPLVLDAVEDTFGTTHAFTNGDFEVAEDKFSNWFVRYNVDQAAPTEHARISFPTNAGNAFAGSKYCAMTLAGHTTTMVVRQVADGLTLGTQYKIEGRAFITGSAATATLGARGYNRLDGQALTTAATSTTGSWIALSLTTPAITNPWVVVELRSVGTNSAGNEVRWDAITVTPVGAAPPSGAVSILGTPNVTSQNNDATLRTISHTVTASTDTLLVVVMTRSFDATNPPAGWTVAYGGAAVTEALNTFDDTTFAAGRACVWVGYLHAPAAGTANVTVSTATSHRGCLVGIFNLADTKTDGSPIGASAFKRSQTTSVSTSLTMTAQAVAANNLIVSALMINQSTPLVSFDGTGFTEHYAGTFGLLPSGGMWTALGDTGTVTSGATWTQNTTAGINCGGMMFEVLASGGTESEFFDDSVSESMTVSDSGSFVEPSRAFTADLDWLTGRTALTWLLAIRPDSASDDRSYVRIGNATTRSMILRSQADNGEGQANVFRWVQTLADGEVIADTDPGTQTASPVVLALVQEPGDGGRAYLNGNRQLVGFRRGQAFRGGLQLVGQLEVGRHAAATPSPGSGAISRILVDGTAWSQAKTSLISRAMAVPRSVFGMGGTETVQEAEDAARRSPVALPMQVTLANQAFADITVLAVDVDDTGWSVTSVTPPTSGTAAIVGARVIRYTPTSGFAGRDVILFALTGDNHVSTGRIDVSVTTAGLSLRNDAFTISQDATTTEFDPLANDSVGIGARITAVSAATNGTSGISTDQLKVTYRPTAGFSGSDSFSYTVNSGTQTANATVAMTVAAVASGFVQCSDDLINVPAGVRSTLQVLTNDSFSGPIQIASNTQPASGGTVIIPATPNRLFFDPTSGFNGTLTFTYRAQLVSDPDVFDTATVTLNVGSTGTTADFEALGWGGGTVEPRSGRGWNIGTFAIAGAGLRLVNSYLGFAHPLTGGRVLAQQSGYIADTWPKMIGGPVPTKTTSATGAVTWAYPDHKTIAQPSMLNIENMITKEWSIKSNGIVKGDWLWMGTCPVPMNSPWSIIDDVAAGDYDGYYVLMGRRLRYHIETTLDQDYTRVIWRHGYEWNQDTGFALKTNIFRTSDNKELRGYFIHPSATIAKWNEFFKRSLSKIREGYGHDLHFALSPAMESNTIRSGFTHTTPNGTKLTGHINLDELVGPVDEWDIVCGSYHPVDNRSTTDADCRKYVFSEDIRFYTPQVIVSCARKFGRKAAILEHNVPLNEANGTWIDGDISRLDLAYDLFGQFCNDNSDVMAFTALLEVDICREDAVATKENIGFAAAGGNPTRADHWRNLCRAYKKHFGKKV